MNSHSIYDTATGEIKRVISCPSTQLACNVGTGEAAITGNYDPLSQRIDIATGDVVDYQPPQPSNDHEWNADIKRWMVKPEVTARQRDIAHAKNEIAALELSQLRSIRELALGNTDAQARLKSIDDQIAIQRQIIVLNA